MADNDLLVDAFKLKPKAAIDFLRGKGMAITDNWFDMWQDAHSRSFTVANVAKMDILQDIRDMVDQALDEGTTLREFQKQLKPKLKAKGWWGEVTDSDGKKTQLGSPYRLKTIYQTNLQTAYMAGRYKGQLEVIDRRPYGQYVAIIDGQTTDRCRSLNEKVWRLDDPMWQSLYPPNHWGCRSRVRSLSDRQLQRESLPVESSAGRMIKKDVVLKTPNGPKSVDVTGIKIDVPGGTQKFWTDPGWTYNPGAAQFEPDARRYHPAIAKAAKKSVPPPLPKSAGLLSRVSVTKHADVEPAMKQFATENPDLVPKGVRSLSFNNRSYFMATSQRGEFYISGKSTNGFNAKKLYLSALKKIRAGKELVFDEEYALECMWHEITHNQQKGWAALSKSDPRVRIMETVVQFVARHTYPTFIEKLGGKAAWQKQILDHGRGYKPFVKNFRTLLRRLNIDEKRHLEAFKDLVLNAKWTTLSLDLARNMAKISDAPVAVVEQLLYAMPRYGADTFEKIITLLYR